MDNQNKIPKLMVGIPSTGSLRIETATSLMYALSSTRMQFTLCTPISCYVHVNRERIVQKAIEGGSDYVLFVDTDMRFPSNAIEKLISLNVDIAGVVYNHRSLPKRSVVIQLDPPTDKFPEDPIKVRAIGLGLALIKTSVFKKMSQPWFFFKPELKNQEVVGEDVWFCDKARECGFDIWINPLIEVGHVGEVVF